MPSIEVSVGEIVDKITILKIKCKHISDNIKLKYIKEELNVLLNSLETEKIVVDENLMQELQSVNEQLWHTEDVIRSLENQKIFNDQFITHARLDAKLNDERFLIKNKINSYAESTIKEQKSYEGLYTAN